MTDCDICQQELLPLQRTVPWNRSPWGDGDGLAHFECADNWEPSDEQMNPSEWGPTIQERQDAARKLK